MPYNSQEKIELKRLYMNICEPDVQNYLRVKRRFLDNCGDLERSMRSTKDETVNIVVVKAPKSEGVVDPKRGERRLVSLLFEWQQGEERRSEREFL
ncbi:hypothetical protein TNCV_631231 [Trichonephila clavipes]|nr:hypothetical protein TNCV_631231 [Trichonephila clavipes]